MKLVDGGESLRTGRNRPHRHINGACEAHRSLRVSFGIPAWQ
jgi:hypothetical protein